jgi:hypothetical protein
MAQQLQLAWHWEQEPVYALPLVLAPQVMSQLQTRTSEFDPEKQTLS